MNGNILVLSLFYLCYSSTEGTISMSPLELAPVCSGGRLEVTCTTTETFLRWNITLRHQPRTFMRTLSSFGSPKVSPLDVNSSIFTFTRTSTEGRVPLMSTLVINPVNRILNGTIVTCMQVSTPDSSAAVIHVLVENNYYPNEVNTSSLSEQFEREGVMITIEWTQQSSLVSFLVSVHPEVAIQLNISNSVTASAQLVIPYNTVQNVSISAAVLCGLSSMTTIMLNYANCGSPQNDESVIVIGHRDDDYLALEGTNVTFTCLAGLTLTGPNLTRNGEWEPDPRDAKCKALSNCGPPMSPPNGFTTPLTSTIEGVRVNFGCHNSCQNGIQISPSELHTAVCNSLGQWEPDPPTFCTSIGEELKCTCNSVIVAAVSSVITFIAIFIILVIGFVCCRYFRIGTKSSIPSQEQTISTLQRQDAHSEFEYREQSLGLTENVAYEPIQVTRESSH